MKTKVLIYGATGYMGKLFASAFQNNDLDIILAARHSFSSRFPVRVFSLENREDIIKNLKDIVLVINLAGPFKYTSKPLVQACIESKTHYIDIAGEVPAMELVHQFDQEAKAAGIMLMPGAGFGVVPTDIVANLAKQKLPDATSLKIGYVIVGGASRGTLKTVLKDINKDGVIVKNGSQEIAKPAFKQFSFSAGGELLQLVYNPWRADLFTARISTGIQNIETYSNFPGIVVGMMKGRLLWLRDLILHRLINLLPAGPSEKQLKNGKTICYAEVSNENGNKANVILYGPEAYLFTAYTLVNIARRIMNGDFSAGFQTPNLYGAGLIKDIPDVRIEG